MTAAAVMAAGGPALIAAVLNDAQLRTLGFDIEHHFGGGSYMKVTRMAAGSGLGQHAHDHDHLSVLVSGRVRLSVDGAPRELDGFQVIKLEAGHVHAIEALTDAIWICAWATDDTDPSTVDATILKG